MKEKKSIRPTESELEILHVLWQTGGATVREVNKNLSQNRDIGYTTTLKLLQIMHSKDLVKRDEENKIHIYSASVDEKEVQKLLLGKFVEKTFRGSAMSLVMQALGQHNPTKEELEEIRNLLDNMEGGKNDK